MFSGIVGTLATGCLVGYLLNAVGSDNPYTNIDPCYHLLMGGLAFGLVFMATDPVSSSQTEIVKWIYGFLIGTLVVVIRVFNPAYPEGVMLVILLMNTFAPLIDHYVVAANIRRRLNRRNRVKRI
jgi:Na+-transporting NADH:ubiquinone oxidoreductase subunit B